LFVSWLRGVLCALGFEVWMELLCITARFVPYQSRETPDPVSMRNH
jgi:hypothetical protein